MNKSEAGLLGALKTKEVWLSRYTANPKFCVYCKSKLDYRRRHNKFCNQSCAAKFNNDQRPHNSCKNCKKRIIGKHAYIRTYCSRQCMRSFEFEELKKTVEQTGIIPLRHASARRFLIKTRGEKCESCGIFEWIGKKLPMIMDHLNGNPDDFGIKNLRLICSNCDSISDTYKIKNKGHGRYIRRKRYADGKSY